MTIYALKDGKSTAGSISVRRRLQAMAFSPEVHLRGRHAIGDVAGYAPLGGQNRPAVHHETARPSGQNADRVKGFKLCLPTQANGQ